LGRCDRSRRRLDRLGVSKRRVPKALGHASGPPLLTELAGRDQRGSHAFRSALLEHLAARLVDPLWHLFFPDKEIPFGADAAGLLANGTGMKVWGLVLILVFHSELSPNDWNQFTMKNFVKNCRSMDSQNHFMNPIKGSFVFLCE